MTSCIWNAHGEVLLIVMLGKFPVGQAQLILCLEETRLNACWES